jgi:hypothetical protein
MRRNWVWQWLHTLWASLRASQLRATATTAKTRIKPEKRRKRRKIRKRPDSIKATSPAQLPNLYQVGRRVSSRHHFVPQTHPQTAPLIPGSTAEAFKEQGFEVITLDFNAKYRPDILVDILDWDYEKAFSPGYFHTIAVSPPAAQNTVRQ